MMLGSQTTLRLNVYRCSQPRHNTAQGQTKSQRSHTRTPHSAALNPAKAAGTYQYRSFAQQQHIDMETIAEKPGVTVSAPKAAQGHAGKLRSSKDEVIIAKKQLEEKEDPTEEEIDAELLMARNSNNSKRSLQRSFGFRSKKDIAVVLPGTAQQ